MTRPTVAKKVVLLRMPKKLEAGSWKRPSLRLWRMRATELGMITFLLLALSLALGYSGGAAVVGISVAGAFLFLSAISLFLLRRRFAAWRYCERGDDLLVSRGVLFHRLSVVPYGRMQFVDVTAGPFERIFHLNTVRMHTAAAASDARIPGLEPDEAVRLRDRLAALGEAMAAGL